MTLIEDDLDHFMRQQRDRISETPARSRRPTPAEGGTATADGDDTDFDFAYIRWETVRPTVIRRRRLR